jgi:hypothetical protein
MQYLRFGGTMISMGTVTPGKTVAYDPAYAVRRGLTTLCKFHPGTVDGKPERSTATIAYRWQLNAL